MAPDRCTLSCTSVAVPLGGRVVVAGDLFLSGLADARLGIGLLASWPRPSPTSRAPVPSIVAGNLFELGRPPADELASSLQSHPRAAEVLSGWSCSAAMTTASSCCRARATGPSATTRSAMAKLGGRLGHRGGALGRRPQRRDRRSASAGPGGAGLALRPAQCLRRPDRPEGHAARPSRHHRAVPLPQVRRRPDGSRASIGWPIPPASRGSSRRG